MGDLANALSAPASTTRLWPYREEGMSDSRDAGQSAAMSLPATVRCASILMAAGRYDEADARYDLALAAARQAGDKELEGTILQHQGRLADDRNQLERASRLYQQALQRFQEAGNHGRNDADLQSPRRGRTEGWPPGRGASLVREIARTGRAIEGSGRPRRSRSEHRHRLATGRRSRPRAGRRARRPAAFRGSPPLCGGKPADHAGSRQQATRSRLMERTRTRSTFSSATSPPPNATPTKPARSTNPSASRKLGRTTTPSPRSPKPAATPPLPPSGPRSAMTCSPSLNAAREGAVACRPRCSRHCKR